MGEVSHLMLFEMQKPVVERLIFAERVELQIAPRPMQWSDHRALLDRSHRLWYWKASLVWYTMPMCRRRVQVEV